MTAELNHLARETAFAAAAALPVEPTALIEFRSQGRLLIIGPAAAALACADTLAATLACALLLTDDAPAVPTSLPVFHGQGRSIRISGHLGAFTVGVATEQGEVNPATLLGAVHFDLLLDLSTPPLLATELPPLGYYAPNGAAEQLQRVLAELPEMTGEFEKPKFFSYDPDICAHSRSKLTGCRRCLDACPAEAITSLVDKIAVDPFLCQGGGACATACPTGAIVYRYPAPADTVNRLRVLLRTYREAGGETPVLLFHDGSAHDLLAVTKLPASVLALEVEEIGSIGLDSWLAALAFGARAVRLLVTAQTPPAVQRELATQLATAHALLTGMGYPAAALSCVTALPLPDTLMPPLRAATFAGSNAKRDTLFFALDWLYAQAPQTPPVTPLPATAPFGAIEVAAQCTLCMGCVAVCPAQALADGGDKPQLNFIEANCVQCGLCAKACPEQVITLLPRLQHDRDARRYPRVLREEAPFCCVSCGKPFATQSVIAKMSAKLAGHALFQDAAARRRLLMCGDCRVRDLLANDHSLLR